jgi:hypothetical protein
LRIERPGEHALGPAKGMIAGLSLSVLLWSAVGGLVLLILF